MFPRHFTERKRMLYLDSKYNRCWRVQTNVWYDGPQSNHPHSYDKILCNGFNPVILWIGYIGSLPNSNVCQRWTILSNDVVVPPSVITIQFCTLISIIAVYRFHSPIVVVAKAQFRSHMFKVSHTATNLTFHRILVIDNI